MFSTRTASARRSTSPFLLSRLVVAVRLVVTKYFCGISRFSHAHLAFCELVSGIGGLLAAGCSAAATGRSMETI
jgi:hypothetical protein